MQVTLHYSGKRISSSSKVCSLCSRGFLCATRIFTGALSQEPDTLQNVRSSSGRNVAILALEAKAQFAFLLKSYNHPKGSALILSSSRFPTSCHLSILDHVHIAVRIICNDFVVLLSFWKDLFWICTQTELQISTGSQCFQHATCLFNIFTRLSLIHHCWIFLDSCLRQAVLRNHLYGINN